MSARKTTTAKITFADRLKTLDACPDAVAWVGKKSFSDAWQSCDRADWMFWLLGRMEGKTGWATRRQIVECACDIAESVVHLARPEDRETCQRAIDTARRYVDGKATLEEVRSASWAAAWSAALAAWSASWAAWSASWAAAAASAAWSAWSEAAWSEAAAAARSAAEWVAKKQENCDRVRRLIDPKKVKWEETT